MMATNRATIARKSLEARTADRSAAERLPLAYSHAQDSALSVCRRLYGPCPFGCVKDGAPNCHYHVSRQECAPSRH